MMEKGLVHTCVVSYTIGDDGIWLSCESADCQWRINMDFFPSPSALFGMELAHQRNPEEKTPTRIVVRTEWLVPE